MNKVNLVGRLVADPELKTTSNNINKTRFTVAVNRNYTNSEGEREADFIPVVAWKKTAELICQYFQKGSQIGVSGRIQTGSYEDNEGNKKYTTEVILEDFYFLDHKKSNEENPYNFESE